MNKLIVAVVAGVAIVGISGCSTTQFVGTPVATPSGHMQSISIVDSSERIKLSTKVSLSDIIAFAENLTNKMLQSRVIAKAKEKPRIVVGSLKQNTHDENLRVQDIHDRIQEVLFNSGAVRVMDRSATNFDYVMKSEITDIVTRAPDGQKLG